MAEPASTQPAKISGRFGAAATMRTLSTQRTEPAVMTVRGPTVVMDDSAHAYADKREGAFPCALPRRLARFLTRGLG